MNFISAKVSHNVIMIVIVANDKLGDNRFHHDNMFSGIENFRPKAQSVKQLLQKCSEMCEK